MSATVFLDTEFTSLTEPYLVSAALVDTCGRELYVEALGVTPAICSPFVCDHVLPLLDGPALPPVEIARRFSAYLERYTASGAFLSESPDGGPQVVFFCDAPRYDIELIKPFLPANLRWVMEVPSFSSEAQETAFRTEREAAFSGGLRRHHALDDARALRLAWHAAMAPRGS